MGIRKQTHHNKIMTREVLQQVESMRRDDKMTYPQIAKALGIKESTLMNAAHEHNICERSKVYKAAFCDKWDFTGMDYKGAM